MNTSADDRIFSVTTKVSTSDSHDEPSDDELFAELEREVEEDFDMGAMREQMMERLKRE